MSFCWADEAKLGGEAEEGDEAGGADEAEMGGEALVGDEAEVGEEAGRADEAEVGDEALVPVGWGAEVDNLGNTGAFLAAAPEVGADLEALPLVARKLLA